MEITNIDFSALLNMVDTFYNNAWNRLILILAIVGVAWPLILKVYSDYRVKVKEEKLEKRLSEKIQNLNERNLKLINKKSDANIERMEKLISEKLKNMDIQLNVSKGFIWHFQAKLYYDKKQYKSALELYFAAFGFYFNGKNELNLQRVIKYIKSCYAKVKDLSHLEEVENQHLDLIKKLNEINENLRYKDVINDIEEEFDSAKERLKEVKN
jgi:hypothetical protein